MGVTDINSTIYTSYKCCHKNKYKLCKMKTSQMRYLNCFLKNEQRSSEKEKKGILDRWTSIGKILTWTFVAREGDLYILSSPFLKALQYLRKLCNHPALVLTPQHPEFKNTTEKLAVQNSSLHDIQHAPKLSALKQVSRSSKCLDVCCTFLVCNSR